MQRLIDDLVETMRDANGAGIAATQVHAPIRVFAVEVQDNPWRYPYKPHIPLTIVVNPVIKPLTDERFENNEGCLTVPTCRGNVSRHGDMRVRWLDRDGPPLDSRRGLTAGTFQHEQRPPRRRAVRRPGRGI